MIKRLVIFFNHPRWPVLVLTVLNCAQTVYVPTGLCTLDCWPGCHPPPLREELREHRKCQETHKTNQLVESLTYLKLHTQEDTPALLDCSGTLKPGVDFYKQFSWLGVDSSLY